MLPLAQAGHFLPPPPPVVFAKATGGGQSLSEPFEGERDALYCQELYESSLTLKDPVKLVGLDWRHSGINFCESGMGIVEEYRWND